MQCPNHGAATFECDALISRLVWRRQISLPRHHRRSSSTRTCGILGEWAPRIVQHLCIRTPVQEVLPPKRRRTAGRATVDRRALLPRCRRSVGRPAIVDRTLHSCRCRAACHIAAPSSPSDPPHNFALYSKNRIVSKSIGCQEINKRLSSVYYFQLLNEDGCALWNYSTQNTGMPKLKT